jgi:hypothetical protein
VRTGTWLPGPRLGQAEEGVRVKSVVDLGPVDPDQDDLATPLDGDLGLGESGMSAMRPDRTTMKS